MIGTKKTKDTNVLFIYLGHRTFTFVVRLLLTDLFLLWQVEEAVESFTPETTVGHTPPRSTSHHL